MADAVVLYDRENPASPVGTEDNPLYVATSSGDGDSPGSEDNPLFTLDTWRIETLSDVTNDDSDKTFTVPANTEWQILSIYVSLVTSATVGSRQMAIRFLDSADAIIGVIRAGIVQTASLTRVYQFGPGIPQDTAFRDTDYLGVAMMPMLLAPGQKIKIFDKAAIAAAADDMTVKIQIASRSIN